MDTRDQSPSKLTRLHDRSHPTHHRPASLQIDYSRTTKSFMELEREEGWWWRWRRFPLSGAQDGLQICPPDEEQEVVAPPYRKTWWILLPDFILGETEYIELRLEAVELCGPHKPARRGQGGRAWWACGLIAPLPPLILAPVFFINSTKILRKFSGHSEDFYFCAKTTPWQFC